MTKQLRLVAIIAALMSAIGGGLSPAPARAGLIDDALDVHLRQAGGEAVTALVYLVDQAPIEAAERVVRARHRHRIVIEDLQACAERSQPDLCAAIHADGEVEVIKQLWLVNAVCVRGTDRALRALAERPDVERVYLDHAIESVHGTGPRGLAASVPAGGGSGPEPGLDLIRAPEAWAMGYTGDGVLVASIDSGVDGSHPALQNRWAGTADARFAGHPEWAWFDVQGGSTPFDSDGHGTHTLGTICGGAPGDTIGVAPDAMWISARAIDTGEDIPTTLAGVVDVLQWLVDPDGNPATTWDVPAVCSNSWGLNQQFGVPACDDLLWRFLDAAESAGIVMLFAAGNEGLGGLRRPADRATDAYRTFAVGAVDTTTPVPIAAAFTSTGPTFCTLDGLAATKPEVGGPGVDVRSAEPGGAYALRSGTSMATPHVAGVVALMRQANPDLSVTQIKDILMSSAVDVVPFGEDNSTGHGMIDAVAAVEAALDTVALTFSFPAGRPEILDPAGTSIRVEVSSTLAVPAPGSGMLYYDLGAGPIAAPMTPVAPNVYDAVFPALPCDQNVEYFFAADTTNGETSFCPSLAPAATYSTLVATSIDVRFEDDFETARGWTVVNENLSDGAWERGLPIGGGDRGDPAYDADGSGSCFLTANRDGNSDVDGGPTHLITPVIDLSDLDDPILHFERWFTDDDADEESLVVDLSNDDGATWIAAERIAAGTGWHAVSIRILDFLAPTAQMRVRFSVSDNPNNSVIEAGIDAVRIESVRCDAPSVPGDVNGDGTVGFYDLLAVISNWGPCRACPEDLDGNGEVSFPDLLTVISFWN